MLILIEGLERCGKTSMVNHLRSVIKNPKLIVNHCAKPPKGLSQAETREWSQRYYFELLVKFGALSKEGWDIIMDRAHIGEYVYGTMYRGNAVADDFMFFPEQFIDISDAYLILLTDDPVKVLSREDGMSLSQSKSMVEFERMRFIDGFNKSKIMNKLWIDWTQQQMFGKDNFEEGFKAAANRVEELLLLNR